MTSILFITSSRLGDAVISTIVPETLCHHVPDCVMTVACGPVSAPLFKDHPSITRIIEIHKKSLSRHWFDLWREVRHKKWDYVIDLRGSALAHLLRAKHRYIFHSHKNPQRMAHQLGQWICRQLSLSSNEQPGLPCIRLSPNRLQNSQLLDPSLKLIAIAPKANWPAKEWPQYCFLELIKKLTHASGLFSNYKVVICAAPHEHALLGDLKNELGGQLHCLSQDLELLDLAAVIKQCAIFIGNDSGLMHLAASLGVPTYGLFGPSDDQVYGPSGSHVHAIRTPESFPQLWQQVQQGHATSLMTSLTVDSVLDYIEATYPKVSTH